MQWCEGSRAGEDDKATDEHEGKSCYTNRSQHAASTTMTQTGASEMPADTPTRRRHRSGGVVSEVRTWSSPLFFPH